MNLTNGVRNLEFLHLLTNEVGFLVSNTFYIHFLTPTYRWGFLFPERFTCTRASSELVWLGATQFSGDWHQEVLLHNSFNTTLTTLYENINIILCIFVLTKN